MHTCSPAAGQLDSERSSLRYTSALEGVVEGGCWVAAQGKAGLTDLSACYTGNFHNTL